MTRPLSLDLRERVVTSVLAGESCRSVAGRFGVAVSSVVKWSQRRRATGSVVPGKIGGHRKLLRREGLRFEKTTVRARTGSRRRLS